MSDADLENVAPVIITEEAKDLLSVSCGEAITKAAFEEAFPGHSFVKVRPAWLEFLELDGYCRELDVAFEFNGRQHFVRILLWHKTEGDFQAQLARDARKAEICEQRGTMLCVVPYTVAPEDIRGYVQDFLRTFALGPNYNEALTDRDFVRKALADYSALKLETIRQKVAAVGWSLSEIGVRQHGTNLYINLTVECPEGHEYEVLWDNFAPQDGKPRKGCSRCHHAKIGDLKRGNVTKWCEAKRVALLDTYKNQATKHSWRCLAEGHEFRATFSSLKQKKSPCTLCLFDSLREERGVRVLTAEPHLTSPTTKLRWRCENCGEAFETTLAAVCRRKRACPNERCC